MLAKWIVSMTPWISFMTNKDKLGDKNTIRQTKKQNKCRHTIRDWSYNLWHLNIFYDKLGDKNTIRQTKIQIKAHHSRLGLWIRNTVKSYSEHFLISMRRRQNRESKQFWFNSLHSPNYHLSIDRKYLCIVSKLIQVFKIQCWLVRKICLKTEILDFKNTIKQTKTNITQVSILGKTLINILNIVSTNNWSQTLQAKCTTVAK